MRSEYKNRSDKFKKPVSSENNYSRDVMSIIIFVSSIFVFISSVYANPQGGVISGGNATISSPTANTVQINQSSNKAIIDWQSFNIGAQEKTQFVQPSSSSVTLNRINPTQGVSQIYGQLIANGQIILLNSAGIYFGPSASVNVGGIIAATANMTNSDFLNGNYHFTSPLSSSGSVINEGTITALEHGLVALVAPGVVNNGHIQANLGHVILASGNAFTVSFASDDLVNFTIDTATANPGTGHNGKPLKNGVNNSGSIIADGGSILIAADVAVGVLNNVIDMQGVAQANSVSAHNGEITLLSTNAGNVSVSDHLDVSGENTIGGNINISAEHIYLSPSAMLNANGDLGGGEILIGGSMQGANTAANALTTTVASGALLEANALREGDGGKITVWSNNATEFYGSISAQGGALGGNGGFVETSGAYLNVAGININLSAPHGMPGTWLLDPENLVIQTAGATTATPSGSPTNSYTANVDTSILTVADLENALANASVLVQTGLGGAQAGDITVANNITWANANTLTLSAFHNININAAITNSLSGGLTLYSDNTGTGAGTINFTGATPQINMSGGGTVNFYYNPASFPTPTNYANNVNVSGGTTFTAYMLVNNQLNLANIATNLSGDYALGNNLTLSGNFIPLGTAATPFTGEFNGLNNSISDLSITNTTANTDLGLFGAATGATIENITLNNVSITQSANNSGTSIYLGSLVGLMTNGVITNSSTINPNLTVTGTNNGINGSRGYDDVGGLVGATFGGTVSNSFSSGGLINDSVTTSPGDNMIAFHEVGGLIGGVHNSGALQNDYSSTAVTATGNLSIPGMNATGEMLIGGLAGRLDQTSTALNTSSSGAVTVTSTVSVPSNSSIGYLLVGGLIGITSIANAPSATPPPVIDNSFSTSQVTLNATLTNSQPGAAVLLVGGLFGQANGVVWNSYSSGSVVATLASDATGAGNALYVGGFAGDNFTSIINSYSSSPVTVTGTNNGSQVEIGGLVGNQITLYDKEITGSYSSGAVNVTLNNLNNGQLLVGGLVGTIVYYGTDAGATMWPFINNYSTSALNVSGQNNASLTAVGGLVGANGLEVSEPGGNIDNSYSQGIVNMQINTTNGGTTEGGGFIGENIGPTAILINNFWDTDTSGFNQNQGVGSTPGAVAGLTAGCFTGVCNNGGTANLSAEATFTNAGWDFVNTWGIIEDQSYPYLLGMHPSTPQAFSGTAQGVIGNGVTLVENGNVIGVTSTGANGFFYFLQPSAISASTPLLAYLSGSNLVGNLVLRAPTSGSSVTGLELASNEITVSSVNSTAYSNADLTNLVGNLSNANILFATSGVNNLTLGNSVNPNVNFLTAPATTYTLNGNLQATAGSTINITFGGPVILAVNAILSGANINFTNTLTGAANNLVINSAGATTFNNIVSANNITVAGSTTANNSLTVNDNNYENWLITGADAGTLSTTGITGNLSFSHIQNLTGGNNGNTFAFANASSISGLINGVNTVSAINTLDYSLYTTPVTVTLGNTPYSGDTTNNQLAYITHFININNIVTASTTVPPIPPIPPQEPTITTSSPQMIANIITPFNNLPVIASSNALPTVSITNNIGQALSGNNALSIGNSGVNNSSTALSNTSNLENNILNSLSTQCTEPQNSSLTTSVKLPFNENQSAKVCRR